MHPSSVSVVNTAISAFSAYHEKGLSPQELQEACSFATTETKEKNKKVYDIKKIISLLKKSGFSFIVTKLHGEVINYRATSVPQFIPVVIKPEKVKIEKDPNAPKDKRGRKLGSKNKSAVDDAPLVVEEHNRVNQDNLPVFTLGDMDIDNTVFTLGDVAA